MRNPPLTEPSGPTRYVTPDEFGVGTNFVGGCPECVNGIITVEHESRFRSWRHPRRGVWCVTHVTESECLFCRGHGTVLYERRDGAFYPVAR